MSKPLAIMLTIPEPIRKIDIILHVFVSCTEKNGLESQKVFSVVNDLFALEAPKIEAIEENEFHKILEKLVKDGFIENVYSSNYDITYEGTLMDHLKGYSQKYRNANREIEIQNTQKAIQTRMFYLTLILALGAAIAGWYYSLEIWKFYHYCP